jgi:outer membrane protein OmpA-like peptidoglycan-associated protein
MKSSILVLLALMTAAAQIPNPATPTTAQPPVQTGQPAPVFRVTVVSRTISAINYRHRAGTTHVGFRGTALMPDARGDSEVQSQMGSTKIETKLDHMTPASQYGPEYMTYVLWAITPEGRAVNLGELVLQGDDAKLLSTTDLQSFGLIVTAEPYFAVTQPSDVVVAENFVRSDTRGTIQQVDAKYQLLKRGSYVYNRAAYQPVKVDPKGPLQLAEAENAIEIARLAGAQRYAPDTFQNAMVDLQNAQDFLNHGHHRKESETDARSAAEMAEDARIITIRKVHEQQLAEERAAAAERTAEARAQAEQAEQQAKLEQQQQAKAEAERQAAVEAEQQAEQAKQQAEQARAEAEAARAAALAQQQQAQTEAERARAAAQQAEAQRQQAENEKTQLRERLRQELNTILETRETARGLIVNINDVLFGFDKYSLTPSAREKLAKVAGILLAYPGLKIQLEGHTDNVGTPEYNQRLSEERADSVRDYLIAQGVPANNLTTVGLGESGPVASNDTSAGRQQNRRVDMVVSGEPIGIENTPPASGSAPLKPQQ